jgi:hypothetical protein
VYGYFEQAHALGEVRHSALIPERDSKVPVRHPIVYRNSRVQQKHVASDGRVPSTLEASCWVALCCGRASVVRHGNIKCEMSALGQTEKPCSEYIWSAVQSKAEDGSAKRNPHRTERRVTRGTSVRPNIRRNGLRLNRPTSYLLSLPPHGAVGFAGATSSIAR